MNRVSWSAAAVVGRTALQGISVWLCARLLGSELMGQAALVWLAGTWVQIWGDGGMSHVVMAYRDLNQGALSYLQRRQLMWAAGMAVAMSLAAFALRQPYGWALALLIPAFIIQTAGLLPQTLALRQNDMRTPALVEIAAETAGLAVLLTALWFTKDLWAVVARGWAIALTTAWGYRTAIRKLSHEVHSPAGAEPLRMGFQLTIERILSTILSSLDRMLVSRFFGFSRLGVYEIAMQWVNRPMGLVIGSYGRVALTDLTSGEAPLAPAFNRYIGRISWTLFPILAILAALGPCLIPLLFGEPYRSAAEMAVWLVPFAAARGIASATTMVWVALKRSDIRLVVSLFLIPVYMGLIWGSATSGFNSFLVTFSCGSTAIMLILDYVLRYIYAGMPVWPHLQQWLPAAVEACALYAMLSFLIAGI